MRCLSVLCLALILLNSSLIPAFAAPGVPTGRLNLKILGLQPAPGGQLRIALFRGDQGWPKFARAFQLQTLPVTSKQLSISFTALPYGRDYAVLVHHDQNGNGQFDMRWFPYPRPQEGVGVSNNVKSFGSPSFAKARVSLSQPELELAIRVNY